MIKVESIFTDLFATVPVYGSNNKLTFHYGEQKELDAFLVAKKSNAYPLLWYNLPNTIDANSQYVEGEFEFVLAHNTNLDWFNDQRFTKVFEAVLFPYFELVMQGLNKANGISVLNLSNDTTYRYANLPNYGNPTNFEGKKQTKQVDIWDALKFTVKLNIKKGACSFDTIIYNINNLN